MTEHTLRYKCGHADVVELVGKEVERARKRGWMAREQLCRSCRVPSREGVSTAEFKARTAGSAVWVKV